MPIRHQQPLSKPRLPSPTAPAPKSGTQDRKKSASPPKTSRKNGKPKASPKKAEQPPVLEILSKRSEVKVDVVPTEDRFIPQYKTEGAACCDLVARIPIDPISKQQKVSLNYRTTVLIGTGLKVAIPDGWKLCIAARSSFAKRGLVCTNAPAQIDSDYRDEILVITCNIGREIIEINDGDRFAQCWVEPVHRISWNKTGELPASNSVRTGGFGSTGVK